MLNVYETLYGARFALLFTDFVCVSHFRIRRKSHSKICVIFSWLCHHMAPHNSQTLGNKWDYSNLTDRYLLTLARNT